ESPARENNSVARAESSPPAIRPAPSPVLPHEYRRSRTADQSAGGSPRSRSPHPAERSTSLEAACKIASRPRRSYKNPAASRAPSLTAPSEIPDPPASRARNFSAAIPRTPAAPGTAPSRPPPAFDARRLAVDHRPLARPLAST